MALQPFTGQLDPEPAAPALKPFTGELDAVKGEGGGVLQNIGAGIARGAKDVIDTGAQLLASGFDKIAGTKEGDRVQAMNKAGTAEFDKDYGGSTAASVGRVGGQVLANVCSAMKYRGTVAACGLAGGMSLPATVAPFILRGVTLAGVDSVMAAYARRIEAWGRLAQELPREVLTANTETVGLADVPLLAQRLLAGEVRGRVVVDLAR